MRKIPLALGVILIFAAVFLLNQGTQILIPLAENFGLTSHYHQLNVVLPSTLFSVPASNYTYTSANLGSDSEATGSLQVSNGREVAFYILNEGNFSLWQRGRPSAVIVAQPVVILYNFTFTPATAGKYFFIFDNQDNSPHTVLFNLSTVENVSVVSPFVQYADFELLIIGTLFSYVGIRGGAKKPPAPSHPDISPEISGWKCKFCGTINEDFNAQFCRNCNRSRG